VSVTRKVSLMLCLCALVLLGLLRAFADGKVEAQGPGNPVSQKFALIYNGPASAEDCPEAAAAIAERAGLKVRFISDAGELPGLLDRTAVFIIGGTQDDLEPLIRAFTPRVTDALKQYLRKGGRYLGICGGGFMASTGWDEGTTHMKGLGIIPAESGVYQDSFDAKILPIRWSGKTRPMFFKAGPYFHLAPTSETVQVIATYSDGRIAALMCSFGKGRVAVCGPHPEARESWIDEVPDAARWASSTDLALSLLKALLSQMPLEKKGD
jgi:glutamine amidotransferase-like uncharacterized protein